MNVVAISDTHGLHRDLVLPAGDILLHGGDFCNFGKEADLHDFLDWFQELDFEYKIFIGGNHDFLAAEQPYLFQSLLTDKNLIYLYNSSVQIQGITIWGSPYHPDLVGWAFGEKRGMAMKKHWDLIPKDTDILLTHTPPYSILDKTRINKSIGCEMLRIKLSELTVKAHVFGHVHASYGQVYRNNTTFINASNINSKKGLVNPPITFKL